MGASRRGEEPRTSEQVPHGAVALLKSQDRKLTTLCYGPGLDPFRTLTLQAFGLGVCAAGSR